MGTENIVIYNPIWTQKS